MGREKEKGRIIHPPKIEDIRINDKRKKRSEVKDVKEYDTYVEGCTSNVISLSIYSA